MGRTNHPMWSSVSIPGSIAQAANFGYSSSPMSQYNVFKIEPHVLPLENGYVRWTVQLVVDGRDLIERLREYEMPFALQEEAPQIAGSYSGIDVEGIIPSHFLGQCIPLHACGANDEKVALLECECGNAGCWPFAARITVTDTTVCWSDFEQPHRRADSAGGWWDYAGFGPFEFARDAYEAELSKISNVRDLQLRSSLTAKTSSRLD